MMETDDYQNGIWNKFTVIKNKDVKNYLNDEEKEHLSRLINKIEVSRSLDMLPVAHQYIVVNLDEPYIQDVVDVLKANGHWG